MGDGKTGRAREKGEGKKKEEKEEEKRDRRKKANINTNLAYLENSFSSECLKLACKGQNGEPWSQDNKQEPGNRQTPCA